MAIVKEKQSLKMTLRVVTGTDSEGKALTSDRSIASMNPELTDADVIALGAKYAALQPHTLAAVRRTDTADLVDEA